MAVNSIAPFFFDAKKLDELASRLGETYRTASPFGHIVIDVWPRDNESFCFSDMTRTYVIGDAPDDVREWHRLWHPAPFLALALTAAIFAAGWWALLASWAGLQGGLPKILSYLGLLFGALGILSFAIPPFNPLAALFGIVWSAWLGIVLRRS